MWKVKKFIYICYMYVHTYVPTYIYAYNEDGQLKRIVGCSISQNFLLVQYVTWLSKVDYTILFVLYCHVT